MDLKALRNYGDTFLKDCENFHRNLKNKDNERIEKVESIALRVLSALAVVGAVAGIAVTVATCASPVLPSVISLLALGSLGVVARDMFVIGHNALHNKGIAAAMGLNSFRGTEPLYKNTWVLGPLVQSSKRFMKFS